MRTLREIMAPKKRTADTVLTIGTRRVRLRLTALIDYTFPEAPQGVLRSIESAEVLDEDHPLFGLNVYRILMPSQKSVLRIAITPPKRKKPAKKPARRQKT